MAGGTLTRHSRPYLSVRLGVGVLLLLSIDVRFVHKRKWSEPFMVCASFQTARCKNTELQAGRERVR